MKSHSRSSIKTVCIKTAVALATLLIGSVVKPRRAQADSPVVVAGVAAVATVTAAVITGGATVTAAVIIAVGNVKAHEGDGGEETGGGIIAPGTGGGKNKRVIGESDLPVVVREFVNRDITISASSLLLSSGSGDQAVTATANYKFDGDIRKSKPGTKMFNLTDKLTLQFDITNVERVEDATLVFSVNNLRLSTVDVANTRGFSRIELTAVQEDSVLWHWAAHVHQGELPRIESPSGTSEAVVRKENDLLIIENLNVPIKYRAPGANGKTVVDIMVNVEGEGARI